MMECRKQYILIIAVFVCLASVSLAETDESAVILGRLQQKYESLVDLRTDFEQSVYSGVFASVEETKGKMFLGKDDKFRIESDEQCIVSNGELLWVYSVENKQVTISQVAKAEDLVRPSDYLFSFRENYSTKMLADTSYNDIDCYRVKMVCDAGGKRDMLTHEAKYVDINGNTVEITFENLQIDKGLEPDTFNFATPDGVEEIKLP
jgi:outer membrane lipoprotein-sorting protein